MPTEGSTPQNPGSTPQSPAPAGKAAPKLDLSHEPESVQRIMSSPDYWSDNPAVRSRAVEAAYAARQAAAAPSAPPAPVAETALDGEGEKPRPVYEAPPDWTTTPVNDVSQTVFPSELPAPVAQTWTALAADVGIGSRELGAIAKAAVP